MKWDICLITAQTDSQDQVKQKNLKFFINNFIINLDLIFNKVDHDEECDVKNFSLKLVMSFLDDERISSLNITIKTYIII